MIDPLFASDNYQIAQKLLDAAVVRQEAIASNIANIETPGYRRMDVSQDFAKQLRASVSRGDLAQVSRTLQPLVEEDPFARVVRADGNSVEIERELVELNRNSVEHEFLSEVISRNIKQLKMAISGRIV